MYCFIYFFNKSLKTQFRLLSMLKCVQKVNINKLILTSTHTCTCTVCPLWWQWSSEVVSNTDTHVAHNVPGARTMLVLVYNVLKEMRHIEIPKAAPKKSICHFRKLETILKWNKQNTVRLPQKYQFVLIKHKFIC